MNNSLEIFVELVSDEEYEKYLRSYNIKDAKYTYDPVIQRRQLEVYANAGIELNYNIGDINNISSRSASFSKTFTLPETKENRDVFKSIAELSYDKGFNPNRRTKCYILVDTVVVFEGYLQMRAYNYTSEGYGEYEVVVYSSQNNLFKNLGELKLEDLDYSDLNKLRWNYDNVIDTWNPNKISDVYFPLIDYGYNYFAAHIDAFNQPSAGLTGQLAKQGLYTENFYPGLYAKSYLDRIFAAAGYKYKSDFFKSAQFQNFFIPYNGTDLMIRRDIDQDDEKLSYSYKKHVHVGMIANKDITIDYFDLTTNLSLPPGPVNVRIGTQFRIPFDKESAPYSDVNNMYNPSTWIFRGTNTQEGFKQEFVLNLAMYSIFDSLNGRDYLKEGDPTIDKIEISFYREFNTPTSTVGSNSAFNLGTGTLVKKYVVKDLNGTNTTDEKANVKWVNFPDTGLNGFQTTVRCVLDNKSYKSFIQNAKLMPGEGFRVVIAFFTSNFLIPYYVQSQTNLYNNISLEATYNSTLDFNAIAPKNVKCKDFLTSMINMFNLYVEPMKEDSTTLLIEPREEFYNKGVILDWSDKINLKQDVNMQIIADTQNRSTKFSFRDDKDWTNSYYKESWEEIYGQFTYDNLNDFSTGTKTIQPIFASTPSFKVRNSIDLIISNYTKNIGKENERWYSGRPDQTFEASAIRILCTNKRRNSQNSMTVWRPYPENNHGSSFNYYPYAGNLDDLYYPNFDLNYWSPRSTFYEISPRFGTDYTNRNLVSLYWLTQLKEMSSSDSRIITCYAKLTPRDIAQFSFADRIYLNISDSKLAFTGGSYFKVNSITSYNPGSDGLCKLELLKTTDVTNYSLPVSGSGGTGGGGTGGGGGGSSTTGGGSTSSASIVYIPPGGTTSAITAPSTVSANALGANNTVVGNATPLILGSNVTATQNNVIYAGQPIVQYFNIIDGGKDIVADQFSTTTINTIDAGKDTLRILGSQTVINIVDGSI